MKVVLSLLLTISGIAAAWEDDLSAVFPSPSMAKVIARAGDDSGSDNTTCNALYSCKNCNTARVCRPTGMKDNPFTVVSELPCPKNRPFCDPTSGSCVIEAPHNCGGLDSFICMKNGYFPDLDCRKFHVCINLTSTTYECLADGTVYNPLTRVCEKSDQCGTFSCTKDNQIRKTPHNKFPNFFAYCSDANGPLVVDSCPPNFRLDLDSQLCEVDCKENGIIPDPNDCHTYYKCNEVIVRKGVSYMDIQKKTCPDGEAYSIEEFLCVPESQVKSCTKKYT